MGKRWFLRIHIPYKCEDCGSCDPFDHPQGCNSLVRDPSVYVHREWMPINTERPHGEKIIISVDNIVEDPEAVGLPDESWIAEQVREGAYDVIGVQKYELPDEVRTEYEKVLVKADALAAEGEE